MIASVHHEPVHSLFGAVTPYFSAAHGIEINTGAVAEPLVIFIVVEREPVH